MTIPSVELLLSALEFLDDAANQLSESEHPNRTQIRFAILHLCTGIELLLKQRLMKEHWSLVFADVEKADASKLQSSDFTSVDFDKAITRLKNICGVAVGKDKEKNLNKFRQLRNKLEHFHYSPSPEEAMSILTNAWSFVIDFTSTERSKIGLDGDPNAQQLYNEIQQKVGSIKQIVDRRLKEIYTKKQELEKKGAEFIICPACAQDTLPLLTPEPECLFCRHRFIGDSSIIALLDSYFEQYEESLDTYECPNCYENSLLHMGAGATTAFGFAWYCSYCNSKWSTDELNFCENCDSNLIIVERTTKCLGCLELNNYGLYILTDENGHEVQFQPFAEKGNQSAVNSDTKLDYCHHCGNLHSLAQWYVDDLVYDYVWFCFNCEEAWLPTKEENASL